MDVLYTGTQGRVGPGLLIGALVQPLEGAAARKCVVLWHARAEEGCCKWQNLIHCMC